RRPPGCAFPSTMAPPMCAATPGPAGRASREARPLDFQAVRRRILLDQERRPVQAGSELLEDPGRDLEPLPQAVDAHELHRHAVLPRAVLPEAVEVGSLDDPFDQRPVPRADLP